MTEQRPIPILIVGAGLGGTALALALARRGIPSTLFDRRPSVPETGGVLALASNAMRILRKVVGVEDALREIGFTTEIIDHYAATSGTSPRVEWLGGFRSNEPNQDGEICPGLSISRPDLQKKLVELCEEAEIIDLRLGKKLDYIDEREHGVIACFEDGSRFQGEILLGVDGINSTVRKHILDRTSISAQFSPKYFGHVVIGSSTTRAALQSSLSISLMQFPAFLFTQSGTIIVFPTDSSGETLQWLTFLKAEDRERCQWDEYRTSGRAVSELKAAWHGVIAEPIRTLVNALDNENVILWAPHEVPELPIWHTQRICLLGDACHAISPSGGQGAAQGLEDSALMVGLLSSPAAVSKGYYALFSHFEKTRKQRLDTIRAAAARSMANRSPTENWFIWRLRLYTRWLIFMLFGTGGYMVNRVTEYDVMSEDIDVPPAD